MRAIKKSFILILLPILLQNLFATEFSGFVDFRYFHATDLKSFLTGPLELDLEQNQLPGFHFEGAIVVENDEVALGQTLVELQVGNTPFAFQMGLFDVPFGIDYELYATADRFFTNPPLTTDLLFNEGWGDIGINILAELSSFKFNVFLLNGMGVDHQYYTTVCLLCDNNAYKTPGINASLMIGNFEPGFSYSEGKSDTRDDLWKRGSLYLKASIMNIDLRTEYIYARDKIDSFDQESNGFYLRTLIPLTKKVTAGVRFDWLKQGSEEMSREALIIGYAPYENVLLKIQKDWVQNPFEDFEGIIQSQVVVTF